VESQRSQRAELLSAAAAQHGALAETMARELDEARRRLVGAERRVEVEASRAKAQLEAERSRAAEREVKAAAAAKEAEEKALAAAAEAHAAELEASLAAVSQRAAKGGRGERLLAFVKLKRNRSASLSSAWS